MAVGWTRIKCDNACLLDTLWKARLQTLLDNVSESSINLIKSIHFMFVGRLYFGIKRSIHCCTHFCYLFPTVIFLTDGNGFKTSTMRLGADVIVFSRCSAKDGKRLVIYLYLTEHIYPKYHRLLVPVNSRCIS